MSAGYTRTELENKLKQAYAIAELASARSVKGYLDSVIIDSRPEPRRFAHVARDWQWKRADYMMQPIEALCGLRPDYKGPRNTWETLPRGHDKTTGLARLCNWVLAFSRKPIEIVAAAADFDQAALLTESMAAEARLNPWLAKRITFGTKRIKGPGGILKILTADSATSFGLRSDLVVCDEVTHWKKRDLWDTLWSGRQKRPGSVFVVITNAGTLGSWQHQILEQVMVDPTWTVFEAPGQLNSWMDAEAIQRDRALLPAGVAKRVLDNVWIDPAEESGYLTRSEIAIGTQLGVEKNLVYNTVGLHGTEYVASVDYGARRDRTAMCVMHLDSDGVYVLDRLDILQGTPGNPVPIASVDSWIEGVAANFFNPRIIIDPWQMEATVQKYEGRLRVERFDGRSGKSNYEMAELLRSLLVNKRLAWYADPAPLQVGRKRETLVDEMAALIIKSSGATYRFDHTNGLHDDRTVAMGMCLVTLAGLQQTGPWIKPPAVKQPAPTDYTLRTPQFRGMFGLGAMGATTPRGIFGG
jgi:hypothetical protein